MLGTMCPVLAGIGVGTSVLVWIDAAIFAARFQGYASSTGTAAFGTNSIALFVVDGVLLRVPCNQIRAVFT